MSERPKLSLAGPESPTPLYQQVKDQILANISNGSWPPGRKIPSENQLVQQLGVSRMTINRALRELAQEGHLQRLAGVGSFVAEPPRHASLIELYNIAEEIREQGGEHSALLSWLQREPAPAEVAKRLEIDPGEAVFHVTLVHRRDELPIQLEDRWVDPEQVPDFLDLDFSATTPSEHLLRSIRPDEMEHVVSAVLPDATTRELLAIPSDEPCLRLERRTWNSGRVVTYAVLTYPSSRYDLGARYDLGSGQKAFGFSLLPGGYRRKPMSPRSRLPNSPAKD
nr:histidine utilization repressor-like [Nerophis lumbriciformis]